MQQLSYSLPPEKQWSCSNELPRAATTKPCSLLALLRQQHCSPKNMESFLLFKWKVSWTGYHYRHKKGTNLQTRHLILVFGLRKTLVFCRKRWKNRPTGSKSSAQLLSFCSPAKLEILPQLHSQDRWIWVWSTCTIVTWWWSPVWVYQNLLKTQW